MTDPSRSRPALSLADHVVLALIAEQPRHGWAIVRELGPDGDVGRVWRLSRPLAYRSIDKLADRALIRPTRTEPGDGPRRTIYAATAAGRRHADGVARPDPLSTYATCAPNCC